MPAPLSRRYLLILLLFCCAIALPLHAQENVTVTELSPHLLLVGTSTGNVIVSIGPDGALLTGTPSAASTPQISRILAARTTSPARYVVIAAEDLDHSQGDAGWVRRGAFVAMQEMALARLGGHAMGPPMPLPPRLAQLDVDRPRVSFSEVLSFDLNGDAIHFIHQPLGSGDADVLVHFHVANLVYFGEDFPGNSYPVIDLEHGGNLDGLLKTVGSWSEGNIGVVPVYGKVMTPADLKAWCAMIVTVRDRVQQLIKAGKTEEQILATSPTREFDSQWGHGRVSSQAFVHAVCALATRGAGHAP